MTAKEAYDMAKPKYDKLCERRLNFILRQIEAHAKQGEFSYSGILYPGNIIELEKLGYTVYKARYNGEFYEVEVNWRNV